MRERKDSRWRQTGQNHPLAFRFLLVGSVGGDYEDRLGKSKSISFGDLSKGSGGAVGRHPDICMAVGVSCDIEL